MVKLLVSALFSPGYPQAAYGHCLLGMSYTMSRSQYLACKESRDHRYTLLPLQTFKSVLSASMWLYAGMWTTTTRRMAVPMR